MPMTCGPFTVEHEGDTLLVTCHGPDPDGCPTTTIPLERVPAIVDRIRGPLGRFAVQATRPHREDLAAQLESLARTVALERGQLFV